MSTNSRKALTLAVTVSLIALSVTIFLAGAEPSMALPNYAAATGQACGSCHIDPTGGGTLSDIGQAFAAVGSHASDPAGAWAQISAPAPEPAAPADAESAPDSAPANDAAPEPDAPPAA